LDDVPPTWLGVSDFASGHVPETGTTVLLVDLADDRLSAIPPLEPTPQDLADAARPIAGPRDHFLARRALLRRLVSLRVGVPREDVVIKHDEDGRPIVIVPQVPVSISVSSRGTIAALAVADRPVGVDLEPLGEPKEPVWDVLHPRERGGVDMFWRRDGVDWPFLSIWTAKEAYLKALGLGLKRDPARLDVRFETDELFRVHDPEKRGADPAGACCRAALAQADVICSVIALPG
jgi:4'-phosphopantetheinyl transferase